MFMDPTCEVNEQFALFVGSLSATTSQDHLISYFSKFGGITGANLITDWATGNFQTDILGISKRCAIVFCIDELTRSKALNFKNHKLDGKNIRVSIADEEKKGTKKISTTNLFVGNIAEKCTEADIRTLFDKFGQIESVRFFKNASTKPNTKNAIIQYCDSKSVELAFKSKSEMCNATEALKISPLKQKKSAAKGQPDNFEDMAKMMFQFCSSQANQQPLHAGYELEPHEYEEQQTHRLPSPPIKRQRRSSSADNLSFSTAQKPQVTDHLLNGGQLFGQAPVSQVTAASKLGELASYKNFLKSTFKAEPTSVECSYLDYEETTLPEGIQALRESRGKVTERNYNFVTLIDIFDDEDNLSSTFFGISPSKGSSIGPHSRRNLHDDMSEDGRSSANVD